LVRYSYTEELKRKIAEKEEGNKKRKQGRKKRISNTAFYLIQVLADLLFLA
jgi:hypothetical protein